MKKLRLSGLLLVPVLFGAAWVSYLAFWEGNAQAAYGYVPVLIAFVSVLVFQHALDWWWYNRYPPIPDDAVQTRIMHRMKVLGNYSEEAKGEFFRRVGLYVEGRSFEIQGIDENLAYDIKCLLAAYPVLFTFGMEGEEDFLLEPYRRLVLYLHPFLTPQFPDDIHIGEIQPEDGVLIFSMQQVVAGLEESREYLDIAAYEYCRAVRTVYPDHLDLAPAPTWDDIEQISSWNPERIQNYYGLDEMDLHALAVTCYFSFHDRFKSLHPDWNEQMVEALWLKEEEVVA